MDVPICLTAEHLKSLHGIRDWVNEWQTQYSRANQLVSNGSSLLQGGAVDAVDQNLNQFKSYLTRTSWSQFIYDASYSLTSHLPDAVMFVGTDGMSEAAALEEGALTGAVKEYQSISFGRPATEGYDFIRGSDYSVKVPSAADPGEGSILTYGMPAELQGGYKFDFAGDAAAPGSQTNAVNDWYALKSNATWDFRSVPNGASVGGSAAGKSGVYFFDQQVLPYIDREGATLGQKGTAQFFMPVEDSSVVTDAASAYRYSGGAPSLERAYLNGGDVFGVEFPLDGFSPRLPTAADTNLEHFLEGGNTALKLPDNGGYLINPTREFVVPGGGNMPSGSVLFKIAPDGTRVPIRSW